MLEKMSLVVFADERYTKSVEALISQNLKLVILPQEFQNFKHLTSLDPDYISKLFIHTDFQNQPMVLCGSSWRNMQKIISWFIRLQVYKIKKQPQKRFLLLGGLSILLWQYKFFMRMFKIWIIQSLKISQIFEQWFICTVCKFFRMF